MKRVNKLWIPVMAAMITLAACEPEIVYNYPELPPNPFEGLPVGGPVTESLQFDSSSILGLHEYIFAPKCAQPGCHDGSFEPHFNTVLSTYQTLVYHPVLKNNEDGDFEYRVVPGDRDLSWLFERVSTDDAVLGRMPLYDTLSQQQIEAIGKWIDEGARDFVEELPDAPDTAPQIFGILAYEGDTNGTGFHLYRPDGVSAIPLPPGTEVEFWMGFYDWRPDDPFTPGYDLTYNKYKISDHPYAFDQVDFLQMDMEAPSQPHYGPSIWDESASLPFYHRFKINTSDFVRGRPYYLRVYVQDPQHDYPFEYPTDGSGWFNHTLMSFVVL